MATGMMESKYTTELRYLIEDGYNIFDFPYDFYEPMLKKQFEKKFCDYYAFYEIGQETLARFQHMLKTRLNVKYPYYKQLYETELASKNVNFLFNKDLKETFLREITGENIQDIKATSDSTSNSSLDSDSTINHKESSLNNGNATLDLNRLTGITEDVTTDSSTGVNTDNIESTSNNVSNTNNTEETTLISQGNIGVTSSGALLKDWREVLINMDEIIIQDCSDLFMGVF